MLKERIFQILEKHQGKIIGSGLGFVLSITILILGFFKALFITACIIVGYYFGSKIDSRESLSEILDRILPPGKIR